MRHVPILGIIHHKDHFILSFSGCMTRRLDFQARLPASEPFPQCQSSRDLRPSATSLPETFSDCPISFFLRASAATASASAAVEMSAGDRVGQSKDECVADGGGNGRGIVYHFVSFISDECELGVRRRRASFNGVNVHLSSQIAT